MPARSYPLAVCDAEAAGGRWVISLDDTLRAGLAEKNAAAGATWKSVSDAVSFFEKHREWKSYRSLGVVGVISDFSGENYDFSGEILNLSSRRDLLCRVLWNLGRGVPDSRRAESRRLGRQRAAGAAGQSEPAEFRPAGRPSGNRPQVGPGGNARSKRPPSLRCAHPGEGPHRGRQGGVERSLVVRDRHSGPAQPRQRRREALQRQRLRRLPLHGLSGWQAGAVAASVVLSAGRATNNATAWTRHKYRSAQLWTIDGARPTPVEVAACEDGGTEYHLPPDARLYSAGFRGLTSGGTIWDWK